MSALRTMRRRLARATRPWRMSAADNGKTVPAAATAGLEKPAHSSGQGMPRPAQSGATKPGKRKTRASDVDIKLWSGFSGTALHELESIVDDAAADPAEQVDAAGALAVWHAAEGRPEKALAAQAQYRASGGEGLKADLLETYILAHLGRAAEARPRLAARLANTPDNPVLNLAMANTFVSSKGSEPITESATRLEWINRAYRKEGLATLRRIDETRPVAAGNLITDPAEAPDIDDGHRVTVIVPAYKAENSIDMTLDGLVRQTWRNLEIIVVDDQSPDRTAERVEARAKLDTRIRLLRQSVNQGSYSCRNLGLQFARGDFITVHDAGDWSHAQKIERQVRHLQANPQLVGNHSKWVRCYENLLFLGKFRRKDKLIDWNPSSLMFRRSLLDKVGGWDRVRVSADAEFVRRAKAAAAPLEIVAIPEMAPLALGFDTPTSLTKHSATHGRTITHGFRREYHEAANHWHSDSAPGELKLDPVAEARSFPAPGPIQANPQREVVGDLAIFAPLGATAVDDLLCTRIEAALDEGLALVLFNWRLYESDPAEPVDPRLRKLARERSLTIAAPGETVRTHVALLPCAAVLETPVDLFPATRIDEVLVVNDASRSTRAEALTAALLGDRGQWLAEEDAWRRAVLGVNRTSDSSPASHKPRHMKKAWL